MGNVSEGRNCPHTNKLIFTTKIALSLVLEVGNLLTNLLFYLIITTKCFPCHEKRNVELSKKRSKP